MGYYDQARIKLHAQGLCEERGCGRPFAPDRWRCLDCLTEKARKQREAYALSGEENPRDPKRRRALRAAWPDRPGAGPAACPHCGLRGDHTCLRGEPTKGLGAWAD